MWLHLCFITQKNPNIYILTILTLHTAVEDVGLGPRSDTGASGRENWIHGAEVVRGGGAKKIRAPRLPPIALSHSGQLTHQLFHLPLPLSVLRPFVFWKRKVGKELGSWRRGEEVKEGPS